MKIIKSKTFYRNAVKSIRACAKNKWTYVCEDEKHAEGIKLMAKIMNLEIIEPITIHQMIDYGGDEILFVDNADLVLQTMSRCRIGGISFIKK